MSNRQEEDREQLLSTQENNNAFDIRFQAVESLVNFITNPCYFTIICVYYLSQIIGIIFSLDKDYSCTLLKDKNQINSWLQLIMTIMIIRLLIRGRLVHKCSQLSSNDNPFYQYQLLINHLLALGRVSIKYLSFYKKI